MNADSNLPARATGLRAGGGSPRPGGARRMPAVAVVALVALPVACFVVSLALGAYQIAPLDVCQIIWCKLTGQEFAGDAMAANLVWQVRMPRVLAAFLVGAGLGMAGAVFQGVFRNPLASPYTLGVSNGAGFGAALGIVAGLSMVVTQFAAIGFGLLTVGLTFLFAARSKRSETTLVLAGMLVSSLFASLVSLVKFVADPTEKLPQIVYWLMGTFSGANYRELLMILPLYIAAIVLLYLFRWRLNVMSVGEVEARSFGVNVKRDRSIVIVCASVVAALAVSISGIIGWVGIVVPHLARMITGPDFRRLLPASLSLGACYLLVIDDVCRTVSTSEIPIGVVTGIIGVPVFLYFIYRKKVNW